MYTKILIYHQPSSPLSSSLLCSARPRNCCKISTDGEMWKQEQLSVVLDCFTQQSTSSYLYLVCMSLGGQPFSLQAILNSCALGFQDVMKCSRPIGELWRWQYNYTGWSLMSYTVITTLPPEAKAVWTCSRGFIKWGKRDAVHLVHFVQQQS